MRTNKELQREKGLFHNEDVLILDWSSLEERKAWIQRNFGEEYEQFREEFERIFNDENE